MLWSEIVNRLNTVPEHSNILCSENVNSIIHREPQVQHSNLLWDWIKDTNLLPREPKVQDDDLEQNKFEFLLSPYIALPVNHLGQPICQEFGINDATGGQKGAQIFEKQYESYRLEPLPFSERVKNEPHQEIDLFEFQGIPRMTLKKYDVIEFYEECSRRSVLSPSLKAKKM